MRLSTLATAVAGVAVLSSSALAGFTVNFERTSVSATLDQVNVYGFNTGGDTGTELISVDYLIDMNDNQFVQYQSSNGTSGRPTGALLLGPQAPNSSSFQLDFDGAIGDPGFIPASSIVPAGSWGTITAAGSRFTVAANRSGAAITATRDPGAGVVYPATTGLGRQFLQLFVTKDAPIPFTTLSLAGETGPIVNLAPFTIPGGGVVENVAPAFVGAPYELVIDFGNNDVANVAFTLSATDADAGDVVSILAGALPAGLEGLTVASTPGNPASLSITGVLTNPRDILGLDSTISLTAADNNATSADATSSLRIRVIPEPTTLGLLAGAGLLALRRRK